MLRVSDADAMFAALKYINEQSLNQPNQSQNIQPTIELLKALGDQLFIRSAQQGDLYRVGDTLKLNFSQDGRIVRNPTGSSVTLTVINENQLQVDVSLKGRAQTLKLFAWSPEGTSSEITGQHYQQLLNQQLSFFYYQQMEKAAKIAEVLHTDLTRYEQRERPKLQKDKQAFLGGLEGLQASAIPANRDFANDLLNAFQKQCANLAAALSYQKFQEAYPFQQVLVEHATTSLANADPQDRQVLENAITDINAFRSHIDQMASRIQQNQALLLAPDLLQKRQESFDKQHAFPEVMDFYRKAVDELGLPPQWETSNDERMLQAYTDIENKTAEIAKRTNMPQLILHYLQQLRQIYAGYYQKVAEIAAVRQTLEANVQEFQQANAKIVAANKIAGDLEHIVAGYEGHYSDLPSLNNLRSRATFLQNTIIEKAYGSRAGVFINADAITANKDAIIKSLHELNQLQEQVNGLVDNLNVLQKNKLNRGWQKPQSATEIEQQLLASTQDTMMQNLIRLLGERVSQQQTARFQNWSERVVAMQQVLSQMQVVLGQQSQKIEAVKAELEKQGVDLEDAFEQLDEQQEQVEEKEQAAQDVQERLGFGFGYHRTHGPSIPQAPPRSDDPGAVSGSSSVPVSGHSRRK